MDVEGECQLALRHLKSMLVELKIPAQDTVHLMVVLWSTAIRGQFTSDNLALSGGSDVGATGLDAVLHAVQAMSAAASSQTRPICGRLQMLDSRLDALERLGRAAASQGT